MLLQIIIIGLNYIKKPNYYLDKKIKKIKFKNKKFKKKKIFLLYYFQEKRKLKILIKNLEKKIKQQMFYHFHFIQKKN